MATREVTVPLDSIDRPIALDLAVVVGLLALVYVWGRTVSSFFLGTSDQLPVVGVDGTIVLTHAIFVGGIALLTIGYGRVRGLEGTLDLPAREDGPLHAVALLTPAALVGATTAVGALTGVSMSDVTSTTYSADPPLGVVLAFGVAGPLLASVGYALVCQGLLQRTFDRTLDSPIAALSTALVAGFLLVSSTGGLTMRLDRGHLLGAVLFAGALWLGIAARDRVEREWLRPVAAVPALTILTLAVLEAIVGISTVAGGLYVGSTLVTLGVAAVGYERTRSPVLPVLAYASLLVSTQVVLLTVAAGIPPA